MLTYYILFVLAVVIVLCLIYSKEGYYPWFGGPWNYPTRGYYPIYDLRGDPVYGWGSPFYYAYPYRRWVVPPTALAANNTDVPAPAELQPKPTQPTDPELNAARKKEELAAQAWYENESKWWPSWFNWTWAPYYNYGLHYDVDGKLKRSNNNSIVSNHGWWIF